MLSISYKVLKENYSKVTRRSFNSILQLLKTILVYI